MSSDKDREIHVRPLQLPPEQVREFVDDLVGLIVEAIIEEGKKSRKRGEEARG